MKKKLTVILLLAVIYFTGSLLIDAGTFKSVENFFEGEKLTVYENMYGTEDMAIDRKNGLLFISSTDRRSQRAGKPSANDGIYLLDISSGGVPEKLPHTYAGEFHPHGISFLSKGEKSYLFVVNHNGAGDFVELFQFTGDRLEHLRSWSDDQMCCPNDLVAVDTDKFYVTNDHGQKQGLGRLAEDYLRFASSYLLYYDGSAFKKAYEGLNYANGVALSNDGTKLYLTHTTGRELLTFDRNPQSGFLEIKNSLKLGTGVDNITVDEKGDIWIAAHPKLFAFVEHAKDASKPSPSEVWKITPHKENTFGVERIYTDDGKQLSGSSVAVPYMGQLFIGVVFDNKLLHAKL